jgi:hypothetical protein
MAGPGAPGEGAAIRDDPRSERVEVKVADEFEEVHLLLHHDGLVNNGGRWFRNILTFRWG